MYFYQHSTTKSHQIRTKIYVKSWSRLAYSCWILSQAARSICTPHEWDASPSQLTPLQYVRFLQQFADTHLYFWVERGTLRVKCLAEEHNTMSPIRAQTQTAQSGVKHINHEATAPPTEQKLA